MSLKKKFKRLLKKAQYQIAIIGDTGEDLRIGKVLLRIIVSGIPNHDPHLFIPDAAKQYNFKIAGINEYKFNQKVLTYTKDYIYRNFPNVDPGKITLYNFGNNKTEEVDWKFNGQVISIIFSLDF